MIFIKNGEGSPRETERSPCVNTFKNDDSKSAIEFRLSVFVHICQTVQVKPHDGNIREPI